MSASAPSREGLDICVLIHPNESAIVSSANSMSMDMYRLHIFAQVVEHGGFAAAARSLYMSQPAVSSHVRKLEESLDVILVDRSGYRAQPSPVGEVLYEYAQRVFRLADEAVDAIEQFRDLSHGRLVVGGSNAAGTYLLPALVSRFNQSWPGIDCSIVVANTGIITQRILDGEIGVGLIGDPGEAGPHLASENFLHDRLVLVGRASHPLAKGALDPEQLVGERFLLREPGSQTRRVQEAVIREWQLERNPTGEMWGPETIKQCVARGLGVSLLSEYSVAREMRDKLLSVLHIRPTPITRMISIAYRPGRILAPGEQAFLHMVQELGGTEEGIPGWLLQPN